MPDVPTPDGVKHNGGRVKGSSLTPPSGAHADRHEAFRNRHDSSVQLETNGVSERQRELSHLLAVSAPCCDSGPIHIAKPTEEEWNSYSKAKKKQIADALGGVTYR